MIEKLLVFINDEDGATAAEYAIMISLIAFVIILAVTFLGAQTRELFCEAGEEFSKL